MHTLSGGVAATVHIANETKAGSWRLSGAQEGHELIMVITVVPPTYYLVNTNSLGTLVL